MARDRAPGSGRYAKLEREQRWVLSRVPDGVTAPADILDRYITGTTLRLRRVERDGAVVCKLGQKVRVDPASPERVQLTNIYVTADEHALLCGLPASVLTKTRWRSSLVGHHLAVDVFSGTLAGLVLAEVELSADAALLAPPPLAVLDVTEDERFSGGALAGAGAAHVGALLADLPRPGRRPGNRE